MVSGRLTTFKKLILYIYIDTYIYVSPRDLPNPGFKPKLYVLYMCVCVCVCVCSLAGYSPWGHKESDTTKRLNTLAICVCVCVCV